MEKDIGKIQKNDQTDIVVRIDDFGGKPGLTIREFTTSERYTGFTKSGTRIAAEKFEEFKTLIDSIKVSDFPEASDTQQGADEGAEQQALSNASSDAPSEEGKEAKKDAEKPSESESAATEDY